MNEFTDPCSCQNCGKEFMHKFDTLIGVWGHTRQPNHHFCSTQCKENYAIKQEEYISSGQAARDEQKFINNWVEQMKKSGHTFLEEQK